MSSGKGLVERRMERVRCDLTDTAMSLFHAQGYDATTVEEIAAAVEVSPRTFYRHFPSKADIIAGMPRLGFDELVATLQAWPAGESLIDGIRVGAANATGHANLDDVKFIQGLVEHNPELQARLLIEFQCREIAVAAALARHVGVSADQLPIKIAAAALVAAIRLGVEDWSRADTPTGIGPYIAAAIDLVVPMLESSLIPARQRPLTSST